MYNVSVHEQIEHDQVVAARVKQLELFYRVLADPNITRISQTHGLYPDIIVTDEKSNVLFIEEVETDSSITRKTRNERWLKYSQRGYPLNIIIPESQETKAKKLLNGLNISRLYYYKLTSTGIRFRHVSKLST